MSDSYDYDYSIHAQHAREAQENVQRKKEVVEHLMRAFESDSDLKFVDGNGNDESWRIDKKASSLVLDVCTRPRFMYDEGGIFVDKLISDIEHEPTVRKRRGQKKNPKVVAAAILWLSCEYTGIHMTQKRIAKFYGIPYQSLIKYYQTIERVLHANDRL